MQIKSIVRSDLILLRDWLRLATCSLEEVMNLLVLLLLMETIICFYNGPLVVILILGLGLFDFLKIELLSSSIFLFNSSEKFFLIFRILSMFLNKI